MPDFRDLLDLASERLGGSVVYANDDFFAEKENLIKPAPAVWKEHEYTDRGKWMDGWESRRRRTPGFDWAIIRLGLPGIVRGVVVDTSYFRGNYPEHCSLDGAMFSGLPTEQDLLDESVQWIPLLPQAPLAGDSRNQFPVETAERITHLRFRIFPDGGVARLRVMGPKGTRSGSSRSYSQIRFPFVASSAWTGVLGLATYITPSWTSGVFC